MALSLLGICGLLIGLFFWWGFRSLPDERWQVLAAIPIRKRNETDWEGINLTFYGFFTAWAVVLAVAVLLVLMSAIGVPLTMTTLLVLLLLGACVPAAKIIAKVVEGKSYTLTIGGSAFLGLLLAPLIVGLLNSFVAVNEHERIPFIPAMAALGVAYALGEGLGRLACVSYGCCYGKPLSECAAFIQIFFSKWNFRFTGVNKKAAYESGLEGVPLLPVQALTCLLFAGSGLVGLVLFFAEHYSWVLLETVSVTQFWRIISEWGRADYRGSGNISTYQILGGMGILWVLLSILVSPVSAAVQPQMGKGLAVLGELSLVLSLQALWIAIFFFTGRSYVTGSTIHLFVHKHRV